ncbi:MAG TPA: SpoIVB peptidase S55 domain-containing protein [Vicinamibacteria bacterium]|nr:SpoIVB peptidase S55 domain-containing protein [Vicinamibacteria bacterium]
MNRSRVLAVLAVVAFAPGAAPGRAAEILPLADVRPGMKGVGHTVFAGTETEEFSVEVIGVLENVGPRQSIVLASLRGGPLEKTGVIAGMSGSPVYIDGKLLGAVAYGFPFAKETIAGITPIEEMLEATRQPLGARAAAARFPAPWRAAGGINAPLDLESFVAALKRPIPALSLSPSALRAGSLPPHLAGQSLTPLSLPLVFSGFDPSTFEWARGVFSSMGFSPLMGGAGSAAFPRPIPDLKPGGPVALSLIEGDMDLSATGTITHIDGDRVYAFGHPFYNVGPTQFPMRKAYVYSVFPSLYQSWKISAAGEAVGTIEQDRNTAVAGRIGAVPRMIPVEVSLRSSRGDVRKFSLRMVDDELFTPVLAFVSLASILQSQERAFGTATITVDARVSLAGRPQVQVSDMFADEQPGMRAAALVAAPLAYLMNNDFERVKVDKLQVDVTSQETIQTATLERAWVERTGPLRAGSTVPVKVVLRTYRGDTVTETLPLEIPTSAGPGSYVLLVADGPALTAVEQREMRQGFEPRDLDQLIRAINALRHNHHLYARLLRSEEGAIVRGEYLQSLPPSALAVLGGSEQGAGVVPLRTAAVWDFELATGYAVRGTRVLNLHIER